MFLVPYSANPYSTLTWVLCNLLYLFDFTRLINGASSHVICHSLFLTFCLTDLTYATWMPATTGSPPHDATYEPVEIITEARTAEQTKPIPIGIRRF